MTIIFVLDNNVCNFAFKLEFIFIYMYQLFIFLGLEHLRKKTFIVIELSENCRLCHTPDSLHNISCESSLIQ